jgi:hypothetical protein
MRPRMPAIGAGATFTQLGATDTWQLTPGQLTYNGGSQTEMIQLVGVTALHPTDLVFV